jgi:hypothetical protein
MSEKTQSLAQLQAEYKEKIAAALGSARTKLKTELDLAAMTFQSMLEAGESGVWQSPTLAPILKSLGLRPEGEDAGTEVGNGRTMKATSKRGRKPTAAKRTKGVARAVVRTAGTEVGNGLTPTQQKYVDFISKKEVSQGDIAKHFKIKNPSNLLSDVAKLKFIKSRTEGNKKFWSKA